MSLQLFQSGVWTSKSHPVLHCPLCSHISLLLAPLDISVSALYPRNPAFLLYSIPFPLTLPTFLLTLSFLPTPPLIRAFRRPNKSSHLCESVRTRGGHCTNYRNGRFKKSKNVAHRKDCIDRYPMMRSRCKRCFRSFSFESRLTSII